MAADRYEFEHWSIIARKQVFVTDEEGSHLRADAFAWVVVQDPSADASQDEED